jgi:hypothetical protein
MRNEVLNWLRKTIFRWQNSGTDENEYLFLFSRELQSMPITIINKKY